MMTISAVLAVALPFAVDPVRAERARVLASDAGVATRTRVRARHRIARCVTCINQTITTVNIMAYYCFVL